MGKQSAIEWTDRTFNCWIGCTKVSPGCDHCYAEAMMDHRYGRVQWGPHGERNRTSVDYWRQPLRWHKDADRFEREHGHRQRVFCASLADVFDKVPPQWRVDLFTLIRQTPRLDWLLLTKRPQNIRKMLPSDWGDGWSHVWLGCTTENQQEYDRRWALLARIPAVVRFISYEPALTPLQMKASGGLLPDWVICGGESGSGARMMEAAWARSMRDDCAEHGIAFFMKQMTSKKPIPADLLVRQYPMQRNHRSWRMNTSNPN
jgi:protein gp37